MQLILQLEYVCVQKLQRPVVPGPACDLLISHGSHPANTFHSVFFPWVSPWHKVTHFLWNGNLGSSGVYPLFKRLSNYPLSPFKPPVKLFESASAKFLSTSQKELSAAGAALKPHHGRVGGPEPRAVRSACSQVACRPGSDQSHFCQCPCAREHVPQLAELSEPRSLQEHLSPIINSQSDQNRYSLKMHALQMFLTACPVYGVSFCFVTHLSCFMMLFFIEKHTQGCLVTSLENSTPRMWLYHKIFVERLNHLGFFGWAMTSGQVIYSASLSQQRSQKNWERVGAFGFYSACYWGSMVGMPRAHGYLLEMLMGAPNHSKNGSTLKVAKWEEMDKSSI